MSLSNENRNITLSKLDFLETLNNVTEEVELKPCQICGRTFNPQSLERHEKICEKSKSSRQRNVFNSFLQRAKEIGGVPVTPDKKEDYCRIRKKCKQQNSPGDTKTEKKSSLKNLLANGQPPQKCISNGYVECPTCNRSFSEKAAERHVTWCQDKQTRLQLTKSPETLEALARLKARVNYRAPLPLKRSSSVNDSQRLVKSAESIRFTTKFRSYSSPLSGHEKSTPNQKLQNNDVSLKQRKSSEKSPYISKALCHNNSYPTMPLLKTSKTELKDKRAIKFKQKFPDYFEQQKNDINVITALSIALSEMSTSENNLDEDFYNDLKDDIGTFHSTHTDFFNENCTSDSEMRCGTSSSEESAQSTSQTASSERLPRFCYHCGTKYPIPNAKFCCECGSPRLVLTDNYLPIA